MKIYLDNCCFNRPFDDLSNNIVRLEAEAVIAIIDRCENGTWELCGSDILLDEIDNATDLVRKQKVLLLYRVAVRHIDLTESIIARAREIQRSGIKPYDSLHIASAEAGDVDIFLTTDRKLKNAAGKDTTIRIPVANPLVWLTEVLYDER